MQLSQPRTLTFGHLASNLAATVGILFFGWSCSSPPPPAETTTSETPSEGVTSTQALPTFLALSDIHLGTDGTTDENWYCGSCETTPRLWQKAQDRVAVVLETDPAPKFIVYLGDIPAHNRTQSQRENDFASAFEGLRGLVTNYPEIRLLYLPGNNDSRDADYHGFTDASGKTPFDSDSDPSAWPVVNGAADIIDGSGLEYAYYSAYPLGKPSTSGTSTLRAIMLNTVMFTTGYTPTAGHPSQEDQIKAQMKWLSGQLADASSAGDKVLLAMHVPPGWDGYGHKPEWSIDLKYEGDLVQNAFLGMVDKHSDSIVGVLTAHTHTNGIRRLHNCNNEFVELATSIPGITTDHGNNPGFKVFTYSPTSYELLDNQTYYASPSTGYDWGPDNVFTFRDNYECTSPTSDNSLFDRIACFQDFYDLYQDMAQVLTVGNGPASSNANFERALDTFWNANPYWNPDNCS